MAGALTVEEAQARAVAAARPAGVERVMLAEALGRVLAEDVTAPGDVPPHDNSAMDGFAVRAADGAAERVIAGEVAAGHVATRPLRPGEAYRIMTGAPIPPGADAVVMVEKTEAAGDRVRLAEAPRPGQHVRRAGEDVRAGDVVLRRGATLDAAAIGVLASARRASVVVGRRPEVAILATGDELREIDQPLEPGTIADTNSWALAALVREAGGTPRLCPLVRDDPAKLRAAIREAARADLIVSTGGVSVGEHDHVKAVLAELGAELSFWRVAMKPGKPVALARLGETPYYGLPGNPVSAMVAFLLFVRPAVRAAMGARAPFDLPRLRARLGAPLSVRGERRSYLRARVGSDRGALVATPMPRQGSHVLSSLAGAGGLIVVEPGEHALAAGEEVEVLLLRPLVPSP